MHVALSPKAAEIVRASAKANRRSACAEASVMIEAFHVLGKEPLTGTISCECRKARAKAEKAK